MSDARASRCASTALKAFVVAALFLGGPAFAQEDEPAPSSAKSTEAQPADSVHPHREQRDHYLWSTFGPPGVMWASLSSGFQQLRDVPPEWGKGTTGFGKRLAAEYVGAAIGSTTRYAVSRMLDEDPSFRPCRCSGFFPRLRHVIVGPFLARKPDGRTVFSLSRLAGMAASDTVAATTWYPRPQGVGDVAKNVGVDVASAVGVDLLREFIVHHRRPESPPPESAQSAGE